MRRSGPILKQGESGPVPKCVSGVQIRTSDPDAFQNLTGISLLGSQICGKNLDEDPFSRFYVNVANRQTDEQTDKQTNKLCALHNFLGGGNAVIFKSCARLLVYSQTQTAFDRLYY